MLQIRFFYVFLPPNLVYISFLKQINLKNEENNFVFCESIGGGKDQRVLVDLLKLF